MTTKEVAKLKINLSDFKRPKTVDEYKHFVQSAVTREIVTPLQIEDILKYYDDYLTEREKPWKGILREEFVWWAVCQLMVDPEKGVFDH
jgi:hypothetical protein